MVNLRKAIGLLMMAVLLTAPLLAMTAYAEKGKELRSREEQGRLTVTNGVITVIVTAEGKHPQFFWYSNSKNNTIYHVKYKGITEYLDAGQEIFQRKFKAELEQFLRTGEAEIKAIGASKAGSKVTLSGDIRENRERATERIFGHILQEGGSRIGVNITKETIVRGALRGPVIVQGTIAVSKQTVYIKATSVTGLEELREQLRQNAHPAFFEFNQGKWKFSGFQPIMSGQKVIGYQFDYTLSEVNNRAFSYLKDQIVIRNRIYNSTVREGEILVTTASMKTDIIIKSWKWNLNTTEGKLLNIDLSKDRLAVWLELTAFGNTKPDDAIGERARPSLTQVQAGKERIETRENKEAKGEDEKKLEADKNDHRIEFLSGNKALGGYFNFSNTAVVYPRGGSPAQGEKVKVGGAYLGDENRIRIFLLYPYFGAKSFAHDPSIGVTPEEPVKEEFVIDPAVLAGQVAPAPQPGYIYPQPAPIQVAPAPAPQPQQPAPAPQPAAPGAQPQPQQPAPAPAPQVTQAPAIGDTVTLAIAGIVGAIVVIAIAVAIVRRK